VIIQFQEPMHHDWYAWLREFFFFYLKGMRTSVENPYEYSRPVGKALINQRKTM